MQKLFLLSVRDIVRYEIQFNGYKTILIEYFIGALLGIPLALFAFIEWSHYSGALPLLIFFVGYIINCLTLFLVALGINEHKIYKSRTKHIWFHLWRVYVILTFFLLCPFILPIITFVEYFCFRRK